MSIDYINLDNLKDYNEQMQETYIKPLADKIDRLNLSGANLHLVNTLLLPENMSVPYNIFPNDIKVGDNVIALIDYEQSNYENGFGLWKVNSIVDTLINIEFKGNIPFGIQELLITDDGNGNVTITNVASLEKAEGGAY